MMDRAITILDLFKMVYQVINLNVTYFNEKNGLSMDPALVYLLRI